MTKFFISKLVVAAMSGLFFAASAQAGTDYPVQISFEGSCPVSVQPESVDLSKAAGDKVVWQSYDENGNAIAIMYEVFFDPFKGKSIVSNSDGAAASKKVADDVPVNVEFKYTIYSLTCPDGPLDPRIRIRS
jgi:hypothetical protein